MDMWPSASSIDAVIVIAIKSRWMVYFAASAAFPCFFCCGFGSFPMLFLLCGLQPQPFGTWTNGADRQRALQRRSMVEFSGLAWSGTRGSGRGGSYYRFLDLPLDASIAQADGCVLATASLTDDCMRRIHTILIMDARRAGNAGCVEFVYVSSRSRESEVSINLKARKAANTGQQFVQFQRTEWFSAVMPSLAGCGNVPQQALGGVRCRSRGRGPRRHIPISSTPG